MRSKFLLCIMTVLAISVCSVVTGEENTIQKEEQSFTNKDLEKYREPSDNRMLAPRDRIEAKKGKAEKIKEQQEKEYWCKKATQYRNKTEKIKEELTETEKALSAEGVISSSYSKKKEIEKKRGKLQKQLKYAEQDLSNLEAEAHRSSVPPGWLRCQFE
ncbi:MAG: OmpH family outer membrane protein [Nitrospirae bacterium]|nr:OmpH family outer membrane protein [Nitrospirota bacterium]